MPKKAKRCKECEFFAKPPGPRCPLSTGLEMKACKKFKAGRPYQPKFRGGKLQEVKGFDPEKTSAWAFWVSTTQALLVVWDIDKNNYGHFRVFLVGVGDNGVINKQFAENQNIPAFVGEVAVKGPGENDIWSSYGYEDDDIKDAEDNVVNKPREVKIFPARSY